MSYCRWSSDDFQCDVYVYADVYGGYTTHVSGGRYVFAEPLPERVEWIFGADAEANAAWFERKRRVSEIIDRSTTQPIGLPHDSESFSDDDAGACADRLEALRAMGYNVPQYAIDALREEAVEEPTP